MKPPKYYRKFDYDKSLIPNKYIASIEQNISTMEEAKAKTGLSVGYPGWCLIYYTLLSHLNPSDHNLIVETGTNQGWTTIMLAQALRDSNSRGKIYTVELDQENYQIALSQFQQAGVADLIKAINGDSKTVLNEIINKHDSIRAAFLDASHLFHDVIAEFEIILPALGPQSIVIFDNTYAIAEKHEDQRVNGALKEIVKRHGGNLVNLEFVSWYTPGIAIWQKSPFDSLKTIEANDKSEHNSNEKILLSDRKKSQDDMMRHSQEELKLWEISQKLFSMVEYSDFKRALECIALIEKRIIGRHCGDLGDKLSQYLTIIQFFRESGVDRADSLEIGTLFGGSCLLKLMAMKDLNVNGKIICIDPMGGYYGNNIDPYSGIEVSADILFKNLDIFGIPIEAIELRRMPSSDNKATDGFIESSFATLMIDGDHSYQGVLDDWDKYSDFVNERGFVIFDDYADSDWPDITKFVYELSCDLPHSWNLIGQIGTTFLIKKKENSKELEILFNSKHRKNSNGHKQKRASKISNLIGGGDKIDVAISPYASMPTSAQPRYESKTTYQSTIPQVDVLSASDTLLAQYKDKHIGQRCIIIGNGPSLNKMDLSFLKNEITFGLNRIYLMFDEWNFSPTYYVSVNPLVIEQSIEEIKNIPSIKFLSLNGLRYVKNPQDIIFLKSIYQPHFSKDPRKGIWEGYTVTYVAMQLAYFMGFNEVILIGVDHSFKAPGAPNDEVISEGADPNHFHPDYFGKGTRWNLPDLKNSELAYTYAKSSFENDGRRIVDATIDGKLQVFPKIDYKNLIGKYQKIDGVGKTNKSEISHLIEQGEVFFSKGQRQSAQQEFEKVLEISPKNATALNNLGVLYYHQGDHAEASEYYKKAIEIQPENITFQKNLAEIKYVILGQVQEALQIYINILQAHPDDIEVLLGLGKICIDFKKFDDARGFLNRIIELDPMNVEAQHELHQLKCGKKDSSSEEGDSVSFIKNKDSSERYLVSAIVSTYNAERFIRGCLEDLENQTISDDLEVIVINSGSEQNEEVIVKEFQEKYSNIKYIKTDQRETVYAAWNRGIRAASGTYITNANTDDRHRPDAFEIMVRVLNENPAVGAVYADSLITDTENETFENNTAKQFFNRPNFNLRQMLLFSLFGPQPMWRCSVHKKVGYFNENLSVAADYDFFIRLAHAFGAMRIGEILGLYTSRSHSIENSNREKCVSETLQVLRRYRNIIPLEDIYPDLNSAKVPDNAIAACLADQGNCCLFGDLPDIENALVYYNRALEHGYAEPELAANLGVALLLSGNQNQGMKTLRLVEDKIRPAVYNIAVILKCIDRGELPSVRRLQAAEIRHPVVSAAFRGIGLAIEENHFIPVETIERRWIGSDMLHNLTLTTERMVTDRLRPALVNVIVRTMNRPEFLQECLTSIASQTFKDFEVIVVNDGGQNIDDIIDKYSRRMRIFYREHPSNKGRTAALNTGLKSARGKYIAYLDDDDRIYLDHFEILVKELETGKFPVVYSDSFEVSQEAVNGTYKTVRKRVVYSNDYDRDLLRRTNYIPILNLMHHRDCAEKVGLFDENLKVLEDWDYWIRLSDHYDFKHIPKVTAEYRVRSDYSNATAAEGHHFPVCREKIRAKLDGSTGRTAKHAETFLVSIVILTCNQLEFTRKCLESILEHTDLPWEIIVVDNGSIDGTPEFLNSLFEGKLTADLLKVIRNNDNKGFAAGNNQGIAAARGDYILLMNNDVVVTPGWLSRMVVCAEKSPDIGMVGPVSNYVSGPQLVKEVDYDTHTLKGLIGFSNKFADDHAGQAQQILRVVGFCMLIKRAVIDKIGGMDDRYGLGNFEDDDFSLRATIAGFQSWIAQDCFVHHFGNRTFIGEKVDLNKSLHTNWGIFKDKWGLPAEKPYGSPYRLSEMKNNRFDPSIHYYPLDNASVTIDLSANDVKTAEALYPTIQANLNTRSSEEVIEDLANFIASYPEFALAHNDLGVLYYNAGNKEKSFKCYEKAVQLDSENMVFQKNLADFYYVEMGRVEDALRIYVKIIEANPEDVETLLITGHICVALEKFKDAEVFYNRVLEIEPGHQDARQFLDKLNSMEAGNSAANTPEALYHEVQPLLNNGDPHRAIAALEGLLEKFPDYALAYNDLGVLYYHTGDKEQARHHYERAAEMMPENINFQKNLADFYCLELGRIEEALNIYVGILNTHPRDIETLLATGQICEALERQGDAKAFYHRVLELEPDNEEASNYLQTLDKNSTASGSSRSEYSNSQSILADRVEFNDLEPYRLLAENREATVSIIVSLDGIQNCVKECIKSVMAHTPEFHEILLINRGATKGILKWVQQLVKDNDHCRIIECTRQAGWAESLNRSVEKASGEIIVLMHNDVVVSEDWINAIKKCFMLVPNIGVVGPMSNRAEGIQQIITCDESDRVEFESAAKTFYEQYQSRRVTTRKLSDFCLAFPRELFDKIGYFDEQFVSGKFIIEDFCQRAVSGGYQNLIAADTYVHHYDRHKAPRGASAKKKANAKDRKKYNEKWNGAQNPQAEALATVYLLARAEELSHKGQIDPAVELLLGAIGVRPEDPRVYLGLSEILLTAKRFQDAKDALSEMPPADENQEMRKAQLLAYAEEGLENYETAQAQIDQVLLMNPGHAPALNLKGILAYRNDDCVSAEKYFKRAIDSDPGYGEPYTNLGMLSLEADRPQNALKFFEKAFRLTPADLDIATNYHSYIGAMADFIRAELLAREAAALYPNNQKIKYMLIDFLVQQGKYEMAMPEIEDAIIKFGSDNGILGAALKVREKLGPITIQKLSPKFPVSVCMIIKDEEKYLARCLASVKPIVDEMIVVDTGSTDRSKDIAIAFGARVYDYEWQNDFAEARNYSISQASGEWILILDGDEVISALDHEHFNKLLKKTPRAPIAYSIITRNYNKLANIVGWMPNDGKYPDEEAAIGWLPSEKVRLFYGRDQIWFEGPVHELVDPVLKRNGIEIKKCSIPVHHYGRLDKEKLDRKGEIYFDIGRKKLSAMGDDLNALRELAIQATILEKNQEAFELWQRLLALNPNPHLAAIAYVNLGTIYNRLGKFEDALDAGKKAVKFDPDLKEARYNHAMAELHCGNAPQTIGVLEDLLKGFPDYPPARFILSAAYCCADQREKGLQGLRELKDTPMGAHLDIPCIELAQSLIAAGKREYASWVLQAAIECDIVNPKLLTLFKECLDMKEVTQNGSHIPQPPQANLQEAILENRPQ